MPLKPNTSTQPAGGSVADAPPQVTISLTVTREDGQQIFAYTRKGTLSNLLGSDVQADTPDYALGLTEVLAACKA